MKTGKNYLDRTTRFFVRIALCAVISLIIMWLWNLLIPNITHWSNINYWQSLGLLVFFRLLCGNFRFFSYYPHHRRYYRHHHHSGLDDMSPEEKEAFVRKRFQDLMNDETSWKE
ncbi:MAG: hypothetical protein LKK08_04010 [Bacteroidales bacterium]|jgi:hypothetical protein|nr:hypothetical protein [Bacteroidales bacterium]MCI2145395.1 hypothetical protein [Bacteroidales bacterium]